MYSTTTIQRSGQLTLKTLRSFSSIVSTAFNVRPQIVTNHNRLRLTCLQNQNGYPLKIQVRNQEEYRTNLGTPSYEGDGKTTVTILNNEVDSPLMVNSVNENGFTLNNGMIVVGPLALFPKLALGWDVGSVADITPESLSLFVTLEPKLDILVIGMGAAGNTLSSETFKYLRQQKISIEALSTEFAIQTFNFIAAESRCVAAALLPPVIITHGYLDEELKEKMRKQKLYEKE